MGVTRADLVRSGRYLEMPDEQWAEELKVRQGVIDCYMKNDEWAVKLHKPVGVLLTSSVYGRCYLLGSVETHKKLGYWLTLSYDNFINPESKEPLDYNSQMPPKEVMDLVDTFLLSRHQTWGGVSLPYCMQLRLASGLMSSFDYVLCSNGDCVLEKPEGFPALLELMGDADFMSAGPVLPREVGTASFIVRGSKFPELSRHLIDHMLPFEEYEKSTQEFGNTEGRLAVAIRELGLKQAIVPKMPFNEQHHEPGGTFYDLIGFRHIHGEHNYAYRYKKIPPEIKYLDQRFMGDEYNAIKAYHETKDMNILQNWWAKD